MVIDRTLDGLPVEFGFERFEPAVSKLPNDAAIDAIAVFELLMIGFPDLHVSTSINKQQIEHCRMSADDDHNGG